MVDFGLETAVDERRGDDVEHGCAEGGGGGVGSCDSASGEVSWFVISIGMRGVEVHV